ncbi:hypothetical protein F5884DRAFT_287308 [Xylogone sp. PMI_703]|nr:hypothetical protein F5884DRAFT_287308 [Xylogone sp. PMI_703]
MLAIQRPSMGSSKPPNLDTPFGYSFDELAASFPFPSPPAPAPGPSLLDDNESRFLDSFFDGVNSDQFGSDFFTAPMDSSGIGFGWEELPPAFMGTTSSLGQPVIPSFDMHDTSFNNTHAPVGAPSTLNENPSSDVLAAASVLQNGSNSRSGNLGTTNYFAPPETSLSQPNSQAKPYAHSHSHSHSHSQSLSSSNPTIENPPKSLQHDPNILNDTLYTEMVFGRAAANLPPIRPKAANQKIDIRWGSDTSFADRRGFIPERQDSLENLIRPHIQNMKGALNVVGLDSAGNTAPSSPVLGHQPLSEVKAEADDDSRASKRRKSRVKAEDGNEEESPLSPTRPSTMKKRKSSNQTLSDSPNLSPSDPSMSSNANGKRRKSSVPGEKKSGRENLTEEQKRENHIRSEQKRRTLIREGFEDLNELVPGLKGGGFSKSTVLIMAAEWLEELLRGNEVLRNRVREMEGR